MSSFRYYNPVKIHFGPNSVEKLGDILASRRALLVTDAYFVQSGLAEKLQQQCPTISGVLDNVSSHPTFEDLSALYEKSSEYLFDVLVALGGGSVLDAVKVLSVKTPDRSFIGVESIIREGGVKTQYKRIPMVGIPTTAGTGSEVSPWATVWDGVSKKKFSLHLPDLWYEHCICDPELTLSLGRDQTIIPALDALSHSLESVWNTNANPISTAHAEVAAQLIVAYLPLLSCDLLNIGLREKIMRGALHAGLAFSNTQTAIAHAMSYYITAHKGVPHGIACSFTLPSIVEVMCESGHEVRGVFHKIFGENPGEKLRRMFEQVNVATSLSEYHLSSVEIKELEESVQKTQRASNSLVPFKSLMSKMRANASL